MIGISNGNFTSLIDIKIFFLATFCRQKVAQKPRGDNFRGHTQKFSKTDAVALLLREKVSVFLRKFLRLTIFPKSCLPRLIHIFDVIKNEACVSLSALQKFVDRSLDGVYNIKVAKKSSPQGLPYYLSSNAERNLLGISTPATASL